MIQEGNEPRRVFLKMAGGEAKLMRVSEKERKIAFFQSVQRITLLPLKCK